MVNALGCFVPRVFTRAAQLKQAVSNEERIYAEGINLADSRVNAFSFSRHSTSATEWPDPAWSGPFPFTFAP